MEPALYTIVFDQERLRESLEQQNRASASALAMAATDGVFSRFVPTLELQEITLEEDQQPLLSFSRTFQYTTASWPNALKAILLANALERAPDPLAILKSVYAALDDGGRLLIVVPKAASDVIRSYTLDKLLREIQSAWGRASSAVRFASEYTVDAPYASNWIVVVIEKVKGKLPVESFVQIDAQTPAEARKLTNVLQFSQVRGYFSGNIQTPEVKSICVLKLDHLGDFAMCIPAFFKLKEQFPAAKLTCVCGSWNQSFANSIGVFDEVISVDYYKRDEKFGGSSAEEKTLKTHTLASKLKDRNFDLAIDFRVPEDSRHILGVINARCRAAIGSVERWPFLDIAIPSLEAFVRGLRKVPQGHVIKWKSDDFTIQNKMSSASDFVLFSTEGVHSHVVYGPYHKLAAGTYEATLHLQLFDQSSSPVTLKLDIASCTETVFETEIHLVPKETEHKFQFTLYSDLDRVEMRLALPLESERSFRLIFGGFTLQAFGIHPDRRLMVLGQIHISEQIVLLLDLIRHRMAPDIYPKDLFSRLNASESVGEHRPYVALAPLSNSQIRDWPLENYEDLTKLIIQNTDADVVLIGALDQISILDRIQQSLDPDVRERVKNTAGESWTNTFGIIKNAVVVVTNNSGIAHVASALNATLLSIYSASHQLEEWGPVGNASFVLQAKLPCAPCGFDTLLECRHGMRCMDVIAPKDVLEAMIKASGNRLKLTEKSII